jgi:hypothetical protein
VERSRRDQAPRDARGTRSLSLARAATSRAMKGARQELFGGSGLGRTGMVLTINAGGERAI